MLGFQTDTERQLRALLDRQKNPTERAVAVFDADGTLWRGDLGEAFFEHQIRQKQLVQAPENAWDLYWKMVKEGRNAEAYTLLAEWNAGLDEKTLLRFAAEYFQKNYRQNIFEPMRALVRELLVKGFEVWIVTASPKWPVQAGVAEFGVPTARVIGASVAVQGGVLTGTADIPVPYRQTKAVHIRGIIQESPLLVAGNTCWDQEMMLLSKHTALGVYSEKADAPGFEAEQKLQRFVADQKKSGSSIQWLTQEF